MILPKYIKHKIKCHFPLIIAIITKIKLFFRIVNPVISTRYIFLKGFSYFNIKTLKRDILTLNLVIIGGEKAGSTFLHQYLDKHPDIFMSKPIKEPCFFMPHAYFKSFNLKEYSKSYILKNMILQGYKGEKIIGETTPDYSASDFAKKYKLPLIIYKYNPNIKLLYILRNPLERMVSDYLAAIRTKRTILEMNSAIMSNPDFLKGSLYYYQLKEYLKYIPKQNIKIVILEEINKFPKKVFSDIFYFLNLNNINTFNYNINKVNKASNRNNFISNELLFDLSTYKYVIKYIKNDITNIEIYLKRKIDLWDVSERTWIKNQ